MTSPLSPQAAPATLPVRRTARISRRWVTVALPGAVFLSLAGCSLFGNDGTKAAGPEAAPPGVLSSARASAEASQSAAAASASASATGATPSSPKGAPIPSLRPKPSANGLPCDAQQLLAHLSHASGAVHAYIAKPTTTGASPIALKSSGTRTTGAKAATYAASQLRSGVKVSQGCAITTPLSSVSTQTAAFLRTLSKNLSADKATNANLAAAEALIADVNAQASRAGFTVKDATVTTDSLG